MASVPLQYKKCAICQVVFSLNCQNEIPYKWCPNCRSARHDEVVRYVGNLKLKGILKK